MAEQEKPKDQKKPKNSKKLKEQRMQSKKEESSREILGFFTNQVDVKKFIKKKTTKTQEADELDEKTQDEFLNPNEFAEIRGSYDDYNMGDLVIVFPNPDQDVPNRAVNFKEAETTFDDILTVMTDEGVSKSQMKKERDSFLLAFLTLNDYVEDEKDAKKGAAKKQQNKKKIEKQKSSEKLNSSADEKQHHEHHKMLKKEKTSYEKYLDFERMMKKMELEQQVKDQDQKQPDDKKKQQGFLDEIGLEADNKDLNPNMLQDPIKELLKVNLVDTTQFKKVKKSFSMGGYLVKRQMEDDYDWICQNNQPKDFLTLVRFTAMAKLCRNGFLHCRQFISMTGIQIFVVVKSSKVVIMRSAQNMKITKQIELGYADLFSLEPVDQSFRPLRLKTYVRSYATDEDVKKRLQEINEGKKAEEAPQMRVTDSVEDHCKSVYTKVCQWNDIDLRVHIIRKQLEVDKYMKIISKEMNIDQSHEKVELIDDVEITRPEWEAYYIFMEYLACFGMIIQELKDKGFKEIQNSQAFLYKLIFRKALGDSNEFWYARNTSFLREMMDNKKILLNLWDRLEVEPVAPYADFFVPTGQSGDSMWRKYEVNEKGLRSEFINMEKIKITQTIILKNINILKMIQQFMALTYFPIHDHYQLKGISKDPFFTALDEAGFMIKQVETRGELELKAMFTQLKDEAEPTDFDSDSLELEAAFNPRLPWFIPIPTMRDYFGEKIALYFQFLSYYTKQLWYMALIGIVAEAMIRAADEQAKSTMIMIFSISIIIWSTFFIEFWKREQVLFSVQYGQQNFEEDEAERPAFEGQYVRSITNDDLNEEFYSPFKRKMKMLLSLGVSFVIIGCVIATVIGIFTLKNIIIETKNDNPIIQQVPALLNSVQINVFNAIYQSLVMIFNSFENHKILSSYENSLIAKIFIFMFVNNFNSFFIIAFLESYFGSLGLCKVSEEIPLDCFAILQTQMMTIFIVNFVKNLPKLAVPIVKAIVIKRTKQVDDKPVIHPFNLIDSAIEDQIELEPYQTNDEVDGTVNDYMELVIQFSFLALFGLAFPVSYIIAFISNVAKIQVDKLRLARFSRRPFPQGASNIGNWLIILEVITFFGIFSNAGLIVYTSGAIKENQIVIFSVLLVLFLAIKYFIRFLVPDEPESARILNKRHQYVVDKVVKGFAQTGQKTYTPSRVNMRIGGVAYSNQGSRMNQDMSSSNRNEVGPDD